MTRRLIPLLALCVAPTVRAAPEPEACGSLQAEAAPDWTLAAIYDATALATPLGAPATSGWSWPEVGSMTAACGPRKGPQGLGVFESEAMANGLSPTLAVLLRWKGEGAPPAVSTTELRLSLGDGQETFNLAPGVLPRRLRVRIAGDAEPRHLQVLQTQLETELCLEHKVGRAWVGGDENQLKQAFLVERGPGGRAEQSYFVGQGAPVPALLGPSEACVERGPGLKDQPAAMGSQGAESLDLRATDVWGASLPWCPETEAETPAHVSPALPVRLFGNAASSITAPPWASLSVEVMRGEEGDASVSVNAHLLEGVPEAREQSLLAGAPLYHYEGPATDGRLPAAVTDLASHLPLYYPTLDGPEGDRYLLLLVPGWQLEQGLRRLAPAKAGEPPGLADPVGAVLGRPELLRVQLPPRSERPGEQDEARCWPDLLSPFASSPLGWRAWGNPVGLLAARQPVALPGSRAPRAEQVAAAQRAQPQSLFLGTGALAVLLAWVGLRRLRDLWSPIPEERVAWWPGAEELPEPAAPKAPKAPQAPAAEASS